MNTDNKLEKIVSLCKRRGFIFPGSEIYGGLANSWDYGPVGVELKNNIQQLWWKFFVQDRNDMVGIDAALIMNPKVWLTSGHIGNFSDVLIECKNCNIRFRVDQIEGLKYKEEKLPDGMIGKNLTVASDTKCPNCRIKWELGKTLSEPQQFNLMLKTFIGPRDFSAWNPNQSFLPPEVKMNILEQYEKSIVYFRPEIAQAMFVNFKNVVDSTRVRLPFGIASQGKAFRNEITPGNFIFRTREFDLMELEYFIKESDWEDVFEMWRKEMHRWLDYIGIDKNKVHELEVSKEDLAHYSKRTIDFEYDYPFGRKELYGLAYRTDFDLNNHKDKSGEDLSYVDPETSEKFIPHVVEPTFGLNRTLLVVLCDAYHEEDDRVVLKLHPKLAPYKAAVFPLLKNKPELVEKAREVYKMLKKKFNVAWDERGNVGKRYYAQDEIGTPFGITIDFDTLGETPELKDTVTVRDRDTMEQKRVHISELVGLIEKALQ